MRDLADSAGRSHHDCINYCTSQPVYKCSSLTHICITRTQPPDTPALLRANITETRNAETQEDPSDEARQHKGPKPGSAKHLQAKRPQATQVTSATPPRRPKQASTGALRNNTSSKSPARPTNLNLRAGTRKCSPHDEECTR